MSFIAENMSELSVFEELDELNSKMSVCKVREKLVKEDIAV